MDARVESAVSRESNQDPSRVQEAFAEAIALPTLSRPAFLAQLRGENPALADEVESLLAYHARADGRGETDPTTSLPATLLGKIVGGCGIERLVGYGGMSAVYAATQEFPRRRVAVKIVRRERLGASARRRLRVEAEALARLEHPNIARVYAAGTQRLSDRDEDSESPFIVMELIDGAVPLNTWANERKLDPRARIELVARIADAIEHAHRAGVIHRDLKPGNVIVGSDGVPKVIDFGIATVHNSTVTQATEGPMGTLAYMSPEQARGQRVDTRSDVWGLGALLYDLLAGAPPFDAEDNSVAAHIDRLLHETPAPIVAHARITYGADFAAAIPPACDAVLRKALANDPERRYRGAAEFAEELRRLIAGEPLIARPDSEWDSLVRLMRQHRASLSAAAGVFAVTLIALVIALGLLRREREANDRAQWAAYIASISAASAMLDRGDASAANDMLRSAPEEHRDWEWSVLSRLCDQTLWEIQYQKGQQVYGVNWSLDGSRIAVAASSHVSLIDARTRREIWRTPDPNPEPSWRVFILPNGDTIVRYLDPEMVRFDPNGKVVARGRNNDATDLAMNAARTRLFANAPGGAEEIDPMSLASVRRIAIDPPSPAFARAIAVTPNADVIVIGTMDGDVIAFESVSGRRLWSWTAERINNGRTADEIRAVAISPDGRCVAAVCAAGAFAFQLADGANLWSLPAVQANYRGVTFSPDSREVIASAWAESVDRIDAASGRRIASITGAFSQVWQSAVSPDGQWIAAGTFEMQVKVFPAKASSDPDEFVLDGTGVVSVAASGDRVFTVTTAGALYGLGTARGSMPERLATDLHANAVHALPDGRIALAHDGGVAWLTRDGSIERNQPTQGKPVRVGALERGAITSARFDDGRLIALDSGTGSPRWQVDGFKPGSAAGVDTGEPGRVFLTRGLGGTFVVLETKTMKEEGLLPPVEFAICGALSPDQRTLAIGSVARAGEVALLDARSLRLERQLPNHRGPVRALGWSADGARLASASNDGTVRIWDPATGVEVLTAWRTPCRDLAWDENSTLWLGCDDGVLRAIRARD
ncbi:MAG: hypothetical protein RLZZ116_93 [Planctomycetota bacterium]|jgi:serine/threonine protein kinase/WD40 repeat protein